MPHDDPYEPFIHKNDKNSNSSPTLTNLRCWNCEISLSPTKSEYEKDDYRCPNCDKVQINKSKGTIPDPIPTLLLEYEQYTKNCIDTNIVPFYFEEWREKESMNSPSKSEILPNPKDIIARTKLPLRLIPPSSLARLAKVLELGANKYGVYNWRKTSVNLTVYLEAILRHTYSVLDGEDLDPESNQSHIAHIMASCAILLDAFELNKFIDDRNSKGNFAQLAQNLISKPEA